MAAAKRNLTLDEFRASPEPEAWEATIGKVQGGVFMDCHKAIRAATGIWVEELVPVFQKYDALLAFHKKKH
ncbi:MAG: hypothetical protein AABP62_12665 [Planctomycetota bacterium]